MTAVVSRYRMANYTEIDTETVIRLAVDSISLYYEQSKSSMPVNYGYNRYHNFV